MGINKKLITFGIILLLSFILVGCHKSKMIQILTNSMEPTLKANGYYEVKSVELKDLKNNDLILFNYKGDKENQYIKRLMALPGDTKEMTFTG